MCQEGSNLNPDLGELVVIPLYPKEKCNLFRPMDESEKRCQVYQRRVVLTTSCGESLIWSHTVRFVIDVGVERRQVINVLGSRGGQPSPAPTCWVPATPVAREWGCPVTQGFLFLVRCVQSGCSQQLKPWLYLISILVVWKQINWGTELWGKT